MKCKVVEFLGMMDNIENGIAIYCKEPEKLFDTLSDYLIGKSINIMIKV